MMRAGHAGRRAAGRHGRQHHAAGGDLGAGADLDVAQHLGAGAQQHAAPHLGMAVAALLAGAAQGHAMQHGDAVLDDGGLADHHAGAVVDEDALADPRAGMDVEPEQRARPALQEVGERLAALQPQPVRHARGLQRMIALEPQQRIEMARCRQGRARPPPRCRRAQPARWRDRRSAPRRRSGGSGRPAPRRCWPGAPDDS